jgi:thiol:disulfide interchange protein DsbD
VTYQGCAEGGLCYNPITKKVSLDLPPTDQATTLPPDAQRDNSATSSPSAGSSRAPVAEQDRLASLIRDGNLFAVLGTFFGLGVLLSLTPCVLPMIPILSGIIVGQGDKVTPARGFSLAFTYVQGMALTYAAAGAAFVLAFKQAPQAFFQQPWIIALMALLFVVLALAMFGVFTLQMPSSLQTRITNVSNQQKAGTYVGTFIMGALSALVVTACVAPAIIAALSVISQTGQIARGAGALYATGLGMGVPLLVVGASAGSLLPRVGPWMDAVKSLFGVLFLGVAIYLATPLLADSIVMLLWSLLATVSGFWVFSLQRRDGTPVAAPLRALGLVAVVYGILLLIGVASGSKDPLQPLDRLSVGSSGAGGTQEHALVFQRIKTVADLENAVAAAAAAGRPVMLDFYADWCVSCKEMEKFTFPDPGVQAALANAVLLQADVTANDADDKALMTRFEIYGPPTIAFYGADGVERKDFRLVGFVPAERFREHVLAAFSS